MDDVIDRFTDGLPSNIVSLAKEVAKTGFDAGQKIGEYINDLIDAVFDGYDREKC